MDEDRPLILEDLWGVDDAWREMFERLRQPTERFDEAGSDTFCFPEKPFIGVASRMPWVVGTLAVEEDDPAFTGKKIMVEVEISKRIPPVGEGFRLRLIHGLLYMVLAHRREDVPKRVCGPYEISVVWPPIVPSIHGLRVPVRVQPQYFKGNSGKVVWMSSPNCSSRWTLFNHSGSSLDQVTDQEDISDLPTRDVIVLRRNPHSDRYFAAIPIFGPQTCFPAKVMKTPQLAWVDGRCVTHPCLWFREKPVLEISHWLFRPAYGPYVLGTLNSCELEGASTQPVLERTLPVYSPTYLENLCRECVNGVTYITTHGKLIDVFTPGLGLPAKEVLQIAALNLPPDFFLIPIPDCRGSFPAPEHLIDESNEWSVFELEAFPKTEVEKDYSLPRWVRERLSENAHPHAAEFFPRWVIRRDPFIKDRSIYGPYVVGQLSEDQLERRSDKLKRMIDGAEPKYFRGQNFLMHENRVLHLSNLTLYPDLKDIWLSVCRYSCQEICVDYLVVYKKGLPPAREVFGQAPSGRYLWPLHRLCPYPDYEGNFPDPSQCCGRAFHHTEKCPTTRPVGYESDGYERYWLAEPGRSAPIYGPYVKALLMPHMIDKWPDGIWRLRENACCHWEKMKEGDDTEDDYTESD